MPIIVTTTTGSARPGSFLNLKTQVAQIVGGASEASVLALAGTLINRRIIQMNTKLYECNKLTDPTITLSSGTADYTLPTTFFKENEAMLVDSSGNKIRQLYYLSWEDYQETYTSVQQTNTVPTYYTLFNVHATGNVRFMPTPDATGYVKLTYFQRLGTMTDDSDVLDATQEVEFPIVIGAQADILRTLAPESPAFQPTYALAEKAWRDFAFIDLHHPDQKPRFRLAPLYGYRNFPWPYTQYQ